MTAIYETVIEVHVDGDEVEAACEELGGMNDVAVENASWAILHVVSQVAAHTEPQAYRRAANGIEARLLEGDVQTRKIEDLGIHHVS